MSPRSSSTCGRPSRLWFECSSDRTANNAVHRTKLALLAPAGDRERCSADLQRSGPRLARNRRLAREGGEAGREQAGLFEWAWTVALREIQI